MREVGATQHQLHAELIAEAVLSNAFSVWFPTIATVATITAAINAANIVYSTLLAPSSSLKKLINFLIS